MSSLVDRTAVEPRHSSYSLYRFSMCIKNVQKILSGITGTSRTLLLYDRLRLSHHLFSCMTMRLWPFPLLSASLMSGEEIFNNTQ